VSNVSRKFPILLAAATLAILCGTDSGVAADQSPAPAAAPGRPAPSSGSQPQRPQGQVTITGRAELEPRITAFVNMIAGSYIDAEGLARWVKNVCPLVSGLTAEQGEFILERLSDIARAADISLAAENCRPNVYILVTNQPQELLSKMDKRNHMFTFGDAEPALINNFISTPQPVRVWYHTNVTTPEGQPLMAVSYPDVQAVMGVLYKGIMTGGGGMSTDGAITFGSGGQVGVDPSDGVAEKLKVMGGNAIGGNGFPTIATGSNNWAQSTRLNFNVVWEIYRVFVIVDVTRLKGVTRGQLADYAAMYALAQLKAGVPVGDNPSILKLFDGGPQAAPAGMTDWDQAFLKSLYLTDRKSHQQRSQIAREMVREIAPQ
jgi:hypothetical protein